MTLQGFLRLALQTVTAPREVARLLIATRLGHEALLTAFALVVALNTLVYAVMALSMPADDSAGVIRLSPVAFMLLLGGSVALAVIAMTWAGRALGGVARIEEMALLLIWLQALRFLAQVALVVLGLVLPGLGLLLVLATGVIGLWILLNFLDVAHGFDNLGKASVVVIMALLAAVLGLSLLLSLVGATSLGLSDYV